MPGTASATGSDSEAGWMIMTRTHRHGDVGPGFKFTILGGCLKGVSNLRLSWYAA